MMERTLPPGGRKPPAHVHTNCEEAFYVPEGEVEFSLGEIITVGRRETFVLVPGGVAHTFGNAGTTAARLLVIHSPAMDAHFEQLQALWSGDIPPTPDAEMELMRGMEPAGS